MGKKGVVLYIGGFELPDKNAAAQRVVGNAYALRQLGYEVIFLNKTHCDHKTITTYFGFTCINSKKDKCKYIVSSTEVKKAIREYKVSHLIAYNYPAIALKKIIKFCKKNSVKCYADATEWYEPKGNLIKKALKTYDVKLRMEILHEKMDGIIAISDYLYQYYRSKVKTVKIPPLVNIDDEKWMNVEKDNGATTVFSYVGSPSAQKEKLDIVVNAVEKLSEQLNISLIVVGITKAEFEQMYATSANTKAVIFKGRLSHKEAIQIVKASDWAIVIREKAFFVQAGFPTKVVESLSCGTPVLANRFSNIQDYLNDKNSLLFDREEELFDTIKMACKNKLHANHTIFHYTNFLDQFIKLLNMD